MPGRGCCFCRRIADADEIDMGLFICPRCARRSEAGSSFYGRSGSLFLTRDDGKTVEVETYMNWDEGLDRALKAKVRRLDRGLAEIAAAGQS